MRKISIFFSLTMAIMSSAATAQDEIIVTGSRLSEAVPGVTLEKRGDFLLLSATLTTMVDIPYDD